MDVFISYSSADFDKVNHVKCILEANDLTCWMAPQSIPTGSSYAKEIPAAIKSCKVFLLMVTAKAQQSQWVPKEISLALSESKHVIPFVIEACVLTEMFNFFLTDVQRYYAFENQSESLRELVDKIRCECNEEKIGTTIVCSGDSIYSDTWVIACDRNIINRELLKFLNALKKTYKENPNATAINKWLDGYTIENHSIKSVINSLEHCMIYMQSAAEIYIQMAVIYIHSGDKKLIKSARDFLNSAAKIYLNQTIYSEIVFKRIIYIRWLIAVTYKQERNFGYASELCEDLITYIKDENQIFNIPYCESLLLPQRELAVINKEEIMSDYLIAHKNDISINPREYFYTQRRLLELYILNNDFDKAKNILPELMLSFDRCKNHIDAIYYVGLFQNLFEYYSYIGDKESADKYYALAMNNAKKNYWKGKEKKLTTLKKIFE